MPDIEIFLCWSGSLSHQGAEAMKEWLPEVLPNSKPWMSSEDIAKGTPWFASISAQLSRSPVCLIGVTPENVGSAWLYYEAGAIAHAMQGALICPYLIGVQPGQLSGTPMAQYQCTTFEKNDTWLLVRSVNRRFETPHAESLLRGNFDARWPSLEQKLAHVAIEANSGEPPERQSHESDLTPEAQNILVEAPQDRTGYVVMDKTSFGFEVLTNNKILCERNDPRVEAAYRAAINDLVRRELLEPRGSKGQTFTLTKRGYDLADALRQQQTLERSSPVPTTIDESDALCLLQSWFGQLSDDQKTRAISFTEVDRELKLPQGTAARLLEKAAHKSNCVPDQKGPNLIIVTRVFPAGDVPSLSNPGWSNPRNPFRRA